VRGAARRRALAVAVAAVALAALLIPLLAGRATSTAPLAYVFNGSQGLRAAAVLSQPTYLPGKSVGLVNSVESTGWKVLPYWQNGQLALNTSVASVVITDKQRTGKRDASALRPVHKHNLATGGERPGHNCGLLPVEPGQVK